MALEYSPPARGTWTIAHVPWLIPGAHIIFVGASCCMRGVVLSAAECGAMDRFSMIVVTEDDLFGGQMESDFVDGVAKILDALPALPPCAVLFSGCIHDTAGTDMDYVRQSLEARYPAVDFILSKMNPTMRKSGITPEELMRRELYYPLGRSHYRPPTREGRAPHHCEERSDGLLKTDCATPTDASRSNIHPAVNIIGNIFPRSPDSEPLDMLRCALYTVRDLCTCRTYNDYLDMALSTVNVYMSPVAEKGAVELSRRLGQKLFHFPVSFDFDTVENTLRAFAEELELDMPDTVHLREQADLSLDSAATAARGMSVAIDFSAVSRPFELAKLLYEHGLDVRRVYTDSVSPGDEAAHKWCKENLPWMEIISVTNVRSRFLHNRMEHGWLAVGQKAAYFCNTNHFVNIVENGGLWGFMGIVEMAHMIEKAAQEESDMRDIIQVKAWGCAEACERLTDRRSSGANHPVVECFLPPSCATALDKKCIETTVAAVYRDDQRGGTK